MDDLERIRTKVKALTPDARETLSKLADVPLSTLSKFAHGHVREPKYNTVRAIKDALPRVPA